MSSSPSHTHTPNTTSFWCYRCNRFIRLPPTTTTNTLSCPDCNSGFIEQISSPPPPTTPTPTPPPGLHSLSTPSSSTPSPRLRRSSRRSPSDHRSPFNPVIVLRSPDTPNHNTYELYYDDGGGTGLRPLPTSVSEFLLGSGFDRLLDQLTQIEINGLNRPEQPPASKAAIDSMPCVEITDQHLNLELHCAVCKEAFEIGTVDVKEMPCKHIYHQDCILPWLSLRNSCPVCRHELPGEIGGVGVGGGAVSEEVSVGGGGGERGLGEEEEAVGLTIWRLPGGGFAVGRFAGGRRERELPVVYTEMDGGFNQGGVPRRISWGARGGRGRESGGGGIRRVFRNLFSCFGGIGMGMGARARQVSEGGRTLSFLGGSSSGGGGSRRGSRGFDVGGRIRRW